MPSREAAEIVKNKHFKSCTSDQRQSAVVAYLVDGALSTSGAIQKLTKGSAGAYTLAAPTAAQEGTEICIIAATAFAHVVTATGLLDDGVTGGGKNTATFGAFVGSSLTLIAIGLHWAVKSKNVVTIA